MSTVPATHRANVPAKAVSREKRSWRPNRWCQPRQRREDIDKAARFEDEDADSSAGHAGGFAAAPLGVTLQRDPPYHLMVRDRGETHIVPLRTRAVQAFAFYDTALALDVQLGVRYFGIWGSQGTFCISAGQVGDMTYLKAGEAPDMPSRGGIVLRPWMLTKLVSDAGQPVQ
ncbi:hypothetical protein C8Q77DRAFT_1158460 [Trametes polyzona]|nr:hypothetical protein C8Q77DRAFT_1158460 [Trametes polyzona]